MTTADSLQETDAGIGKKLKRGVAKGRNVAKKGAQVGMKAAKKGAALAKKTGKAILNTAVKVIRKMLKIIEKLGLDASIAFQGQRYMGMVRGSILKGNAKIKRGTTTVISITSSFDPNGDQSKLIQYANKHLIPPVACVAVALDWDAQRSQGDGSDGGSDGGGDQGGGSGEGEAQLFAELDATFRRTFNQHKDDGDGGSDGGSDAGSGSADGAGSASGGGSGGGDAISLTPEVVLQGLRIPNAFVIGVKTQPFQVKLLASGDLSKALAVGKAVGKFAKKGLKKLRH